MKQFLFACCALLFGGFSAVQAAPATSTPAGSTPSLKWVTAYYPGWEQDYLKPSDIDFSAITHLVHFAVIPKADGSLDTANFNFTPERSAAIVKATHDAGRKVLLCIGGANSAPAFRGAIAPASRATFIKNLTDIVRERDYDGLDIDMEPLEAKDSDDYQTFIHELRAAMRAADPKLLLTCAVGDEPQIFVDLQNEFDQINIMTYAQSGTWPGWSTWHNASLRNTGMNIPGSQRLLPSAQLWLEKWLAAGFKPSQLGIGIAFYGLLWQGATAPLQSIEGVKTRSINYRDLMRQYFQPERYHWDDKAEAPYLSVDEPGTAGDLFISYDDERLVKMKVDYARAQGLGGVIIWQLGSGYRADAPEGERDPLLQAVKQAAFGKTPASSALNR